MKPLGNRGSAFIQALVAVGVVGIMLYYLSPQVVKHRQQVTKTASIITARLALHSMVDFTLHGIKQRWCFSKDWMPESCGTTMAEVLSHERSVERVLLKNESLNFLKLSGISKPEKALLSKISQTISLKSFSALHPVYKIVADLKGYKVDSFFVEIARDNRGVIPEYGREVYLTVKVSLLDTSGNPIRIGNSTLSTVSKVGVYPREVGSFALVVAGDMHLDKQNPNAGLEARGDSFIKNFTSREARITKPGLIFESPVFVNGALRLPEAPALEEDKKGSDTIYTPVTFQEKLILGDGPVMRGAAEFKPRGAGDQNDQFWANLRQVGGFQKGIEVDGARDLGLDFLSGLRTSMATIDPSEMKLCIDYNLAKYDLSKTTNSQLRGQLMKSTGSKFDFRLGLTDKNRFNPQSGSTNDPYGPGILKSWSMDKKELAIAKFEMFFGHQSVKGELADNGTLVLEPRINLSKMKDKIKDQIRDAEGSISNKEWTIRSLENQMRALGKDVEDLESELQAEKNKNPQNPGRIASLENALNAKKNDLGRVSSDKQRLETEISNLQASIADLKDQLAGVESQEAIQPKVIISVKTPGNPSDPENSGNASFRDISVNFENGAMLIDDDGRPLSINLKLEAYDVSYYQKSSLRSFSDNNEGWLNFKRDSGGGIHAENNLQLTQAGTSKGSLPTENPTRNYDVFCKTPENSAFASSDWGQSFAPNSKFSWSFTDAYDSRTNFVLDGNNAYSSGSTNTVAFIVKSMARDCIIRSSANFVAGFFTCERLVIEPRTSPLRIIGSFILANGLRIDDSAYDAGIRWSSIYHPMATYELRRARVLKGMNDQDCNSIQRYPVWHPYPSITNVANLYRCNAISLRAKADPFRWTSVDPDCGLKSGATSTTCKNRLVRFYVLEVSRESGI